VTVWFYDDSACLNEPWELSGENALASGTCESIYFEREGTDGAIAIWPEVSVEKEDAENTDCNIDSEPLSPPSWSLDAIGCGLDDPSSAGCGAGTCVARSNTTSYCVAQQGNQSCPEAFPEKRLMHTDFLDDRACGDCECDLECASSFRAYTDESCAVDEQSLSATQPCAPLSRDVTPELEAGLVWETRSFLVAAPSCEPTSSASGAAAPSGSVTVCCESEP
jgi:hypothetical protein